MPSVSASAVGPLICAHTSSRESSSSAAIGHVLTGEGHLVNREFGGHGIGSTMRQDPHVPDDGRPVRAAHAEHTIAITEDGPEILTRPSSAGR